MLQRAFESTLPTSRSGGSVRSAAANPGCRGDSSELRIASSPLSRSTGGLAWVLQIASECKGLSSRSGRSWIMTSFDVNSSGRLIARVSKALTSPSERLDADREVRLWSSKSPRDISSTAWFEGFSAGVFSRGAVETRPTEKSSVLLRLRDSCQVRLLEGNHHKRPSLVSSVPAIVFPKMKWFSHWSVLRLPKLSVKT